MAEKSENDSMRYANFIEKALEQLGNLESGIDLNVHRSLLEEASMLISSETLQEGEKVTCEQVFEGLGGWSALNALREALGVCVQSAGTANISENVKESLVLPSDKTTENVGTKRNRDHVSSQELNEGDVVPTSRGADETRPVTKSLTDNKGSSDKNSGMGALEGLIDRACEAKYHGSFFTGLVKGFKRDPRGEMRVEVEFFGYKSRATCAADDVIILRPPSMQLLTPGALIQAIFTGDGLWYDAVVEGMSPNGRDVTVSYPEYQAAELLPIDRVRLRSQRPNNDDGAAQGGKVATSKKKKEIVTPGGFILPERLLPKATDSAEVRAVKKSKIQSIKKEQREQKIDETYNKSASDWKNFTAKRPRFGGSSAFPSQK